MDVCKDGIGEILHGPCKKCPQKVRMPNQAFKTNLNSSRANIHQLSSYPHAPYAPLVLSI